MSKEFSIESAWRAWVDDLPGIIQARRRLIVQTINFNRLAKKWESYDKAVANMLYMGTLPHESMEARREAIAVGNIYNWNAGAIRKALLS